MLSALSPASTAVLDEVLATAHGPVDVDLARKAAAAARRADFNRVVIRTRVSADTARAAAALLLGTAHIEFVGYTVGGPVYRAVPAAWRAPVADDYAYDTRA